MTMEELFKWGDAVIARTHDLVAAGRQAVHDAQVIERDRQRLLGPDGASRGTSGRMEEAASEVSGQFHHDARVKRLPVEQEG